MQTLNYRNFKVGVALSLLASIIILSVSFTIGKDNFFLLLNIDLGEFADYFFSAYTNMGDGILWIAVLAIILLMKRRDVLPLIISAFIFTTILTQACKYIIVPDIMRPAFAIKNASLIHVVQGVELHHNSSFPSGHTATAFTFYLLFCLLIPQNWWLIVGFIYALLVAYSRVYLGQHFPLDTGAGIIVSVASLSLSLVVHKYWVKSKSPS